VSKILMALIRCLWWMERWANDTESDTLNIKLSLYIVGLDYKMGLVFHVDDALLGRVLFVLLYIMFDVFWCRCVRACHQSQQI